MSVAGRARDAAGVVRSVVALVRDEEVTFLAAAIAYYAFVSVLPALLLTFVVVTVVGGDVLAARLVDAGGSFLSPAGRAGLEEAITGARGRGGATVIGVVLLLWSTLRVFRGLDIAFSRVYEVSEGPSLVSQVRDGLIVIVTVGVGISTMLAVGAALAATDLPAGREVLGFVVLLVGLFFVFLPLYYVFPDTAVGVREVAPGAALAAVAWVGLQALFQVYAEAAPGYDLYGVIGGVLLLVTWFYVAAVALLVGAVVNVVLARENRQGQGPARRTE